MDTPKSPSMSLVHKRAAAETALMPPPPPPKRIKRPKRVIDEDSYTDALSHIIARDFFPGLLETKAQREYLDALESRDESRIFHAAQHLQTVMTPGRNRTGRTPRAPSAAPDQTPIKNPPDTPGSTISVASTTTSQRLVRDTNLSLAAFQARYTSEDNESVYKLLDRQNQKRTEKYAWQWNGNKMPSKMQIKQKEIEAKLSETLSLHDDGWHKKDRLAIKDKDDRPAAPEAWKSRAKNELIFHPDGLGDSVETMEQKAQAESRAAPRCIVYENTWMRKTEEEEEAPAAEEDTASAVQDAIAGRWGRFYQESSVMSGGETPRVNGYAFVDDEEPIPESPTRTLTPAPIFELGGGDPTPNPFQLQEQGRREALHHRMVERIAQSKRSASQSRPGGKAAVTPVPGFPNSPGRTGNLTPAAQRLLNNIGEGASSRRGTPLLGGGSTLRHQVKY